MAHAYAVDMANYCRIKPLVRSGVFEDADLVDGNLEFWLEWDHGAIVPYLGWDAGTLQSQPIGVGGGTLAWSNGLGNILVDGDGKAYGATSGHNVITGTGSQGSFPWVRTDVDISCTVTIGTTGAGLAWRVESTNQACYIYFNVAAGRAVIDVRANTTDVRGLTGTTPIAQGETRTLRFTCISDVWELFVDGVSQGTFTDTTINTKKKWGIVTKDTTSRVSNIVGVNTATCPATSYEVINDDGVVVVSGAVSGYKIVVADSALVGRDGRGPYGGYKLRLYGATVGNYGTAKGNITFTRVQTDARFTDKPHPFSATIGSNSWDVGLRSFFGLGATRFAMDDGTPAVPAAYLQTNYVADALPTRPRYVIGHWRGDNAGQAATITAYVAANKALFQAWEPYNEPSGVSTAVNFAADQEYFYNAVKAGDPDAIVLGPNPVVYTVDRNDGLPWIEDFLAAGADAHLDGLSVHGYNGTNGDIYMGRRHLSALKALADQYDLPLWQTEQSHNVQYGNLFDVTHALRWNAVQLMVQECYGLPIERNVLWYDREHGFAGYTTYWSDKTSSYSIPVMVRTMVAEIGDRTFDSEYDLGDWLDVYLCPKWVGTDGTATVGVLAQSKGQPPVRFYLTGATSATAVDAFGNEFTLTRDGDNIIEVPAYDLPTWVRIPSGVTLTLVATDWEIGTNLATTATVTASTGVTKNAQALVAQAWRNHYSSGGGFPAENTVQPFYNVADSATVPASALTPVTVTATLPTAQTVSRVVVASAIPWQLSYSTPTDFDIDISPDGTTWTTVHTETPDTSTTSAFVSDVLSSKTTIDSWFNPQTVWDVTFTQQTVKAVRLVIRDVSWGGHETQASSAAVWDGGSAKWVSLRGLRMYPAETSFDPDRPRFNLTVTCSG